MDEEILSTKRFFDSHQITLSDYWLESCIQWHREENPDLNYTMETLHLKVYAQWLLLDFRDVEVPILPQNLAQQKKIVLNGIFSLQMLHITDISRPKLWQLQKLRNSNVLANAAMDQENQNPSNNSGRRVLHLVLTDGVQEVEAMEYKPISVLNVNLAPGTKIRIIGPVTVRRGQILLEEKHINVLGGEVEELLVANAAENILARALNLPENRNPNAIEETFVPANVDVSQNMRNQPRPTNNLHQQNRGNALDCNVNVNSTKAPIQENRSSKTTVVVANDINSDFVIEDELKIMNEIDMLLEAERDIEAESKRLKTSSPDMFEDINMDTSDTAKNANVDASIDKKVDTDITRKKNEEIDTTIFEEIDIDAHLDLVDEQIKNVQNTTVQKGIMPINHLVKNRNSINSGKFTIKAKFKSVIEKLTVRDDAWLLKLLIADDTGDLQVYVHSDIISSLMGYCPSAIMAMKKDIVDKDECATATVMKIIEGLKTKIMQLNCLVDVMFTPNEEFPTIILLK